MRAAACAPIGASAGSAPSWRCCADSRARASGTCFATSTATSGRRAAGSTPRRRGGYRLDHLVASREFEPLSCGYLHDHRDAGLSDHAPLVADLRLAAGA
ncbi:MAG TPA: hypothetical protein VEW67_07300 [Thermoleophilaceae bacterium]|nr:hypothetical protein [Thermoleophilaceae bacterium]